jgi:formate hydrogenlyase transcriptional activator
VIISPGEQLQIGKWLMASGKSPGAAASLSLEAVEKNHILEVLEMAGWRVSGAKGAANILGLKPTTLEARMKKLGIERKR